MVPEIWSTTDRIFCHSGLFFAFLPPKNPGHQNFENMNKRLRDSIILQMHMVYDAWFLRYEV